MRRQRVREALGPKPASKILQRAWGVDEDHGPDAFFPPYAGAQNSSDTCQPPTAHEVAPRAITSCQIIFLDEWRDLQQTESQNINLIFRLLAAYLHPLPTKRCTLSEQVKGSLRMCFQTGTRRSFSPSTLLDMIRRQFQKNDEYALYVGITWFSLHRHRGLSESNVLVVDLAASLRVLRESEYPHHPISAVKVLLPVIFRALKIPGPCKLFSCILNPVQASLGPEEGKAVSQFFPGLPRPLTLCPPCLRQFCLRYNSSNLSRSESMEASLVRRLEAICVVLSVLSFVLAECEIKQQIQWYKERIMFVTEKYDEETLTLKIKVAAEALATELLIESTGLRSFIDVDESPHPKANKICTSHTEDLRRFHLSSTRVGSPPLLEKSQYVHRLDGDCSHTGEEDILHYGGETTLADRVNVSPAVRTREYKAKSRSDSPMDEAAAVHLPLKVQVASPEPMDRSKLSILKKKLRRRQRASKLTNVES